MSKVMRIEEPAHLATIIDFIHDCWFERDSIRLDPERSELIIRFVRPDAGRGSVVQKVLFVKRVRVPVMECLLRIHHVRDFSVEDKAQVGRYDFNEILFHEGEKRIRITTGVPIGIEIQVDRFEVSVEETDNVVEEKMTTLIF